MMSNKTNEILTDFLAGKNSRDGIVIKDCRAKELMIIARYGGDIIVSFYNVNDLTEPTFICLFEMEKNNKMNWNKIFLRFAEIKSMLRER